MSDEGYNGWKNYPTWAVHLWLTNEPGSYEECRQMAARAIEEVHPRFALSDALKHTVRDMVEDPFGRGEVEADMAGDLLGYALDCVDWYEIADAFLEDVKEEEATIA